MYIAALCAGGRIVTGRNHGDAFSKLTDREKDSEISSGFIDQDKLKFITDDCEYYLKKIVMLRHADSAGNWNSPITEMGRSQAKKAAAFVVSLLDLHNCTALCSPLRRCVETAQIFQQSCGIHFEIDHRLLKQSCKENTESFLTRIHQVLDSLPEKSLIISHCDFIQIMTQLATGVVVTSNIPNCSTTYIENHKAVLLARPCDDNKEEKANGLG